MIEFEYQCGSGKTLAALASTAACAFAYKIAKGIGNFESRVVWYVARTRDQVQAIAKAAEQFPAFRDRGVCALLGRCSEPHRSALVSCPHERAEEQLRSATRPGLIATTYNRPNLLR